MNKKNQVSYCMNCKKEVGESIELCECGGRYFVFGEKDSFILCENGIVCKCGNDKFERTMHIDYTNKSNSNYICSECKTVIGTESYRRPEDVMLWED